MYISVFPMVLGDPYEGFVGPPKCVVTHRLRTTVSELVDAAAFSVLVQQSSRVR